MPCILVQLSGERGIDFAVEHTAPPKRANECSPSPGELVAFSAKAFKKLFPNQDLTERNELANGSALQTWIEKIEAEPEVKSKQTCKTELNNCEKNDTKIHLVTWIHQTVKDAIQSEANKTGYSLSRFIETILANWLNSNEDRKKKFVNDNTNNVNHAAYALGQLASKEYETFGTVSFDGYLFDVTSKKLTALRKKFISAYKFTEDVGKLFENIPPTFYSTKLNRRHYAWFFAGFCGIDWTAIR